jgi:hypothetical protein
MSFYAEATQKKKPMRGGEGLPNRIFGLASRTKLTFAEAASLLLQPTNESFAMPPQATEGPQTEDNAPSFFRVPAPIKQLFDRFPLTTYPANDLPQRVPSGRADSQLFVFSDAASARRGRPSFNPQCLKWQVSLRPIRIYGTAFSNAVSAGVPEICRDRL